MVGYMKDIETKMDDWVVADKGCLHKPAPTFFSVPTFVFALV